MSAAASDRMRPRRPIVSLWVPLAFYALVALGTVVWVALGGAQAGVPSAMWGRYLIWQSGILAAVILSTNAVWARRWGWASVGALLTLAGIAFEMLALPLDLYGCSEWVREAREAGVFRLW